MAKYRLQALTHEAWASLDTIRTRWAYPDIYDRLLQGEPFYLTDYEGTLEAFHRLRHTVNRWCRKRGILVAHRFNSETRIAAWQPIGTKEARLTKADYPDSTDHPPIDRRVPPRVKRQREAWEAANRPTDPPSFEELMASKKKG